MSGVVPEEGLEPSQGYPYRILSPARLPFHHSGTRVNIDNERARSMQERRRFREQTGPLKEQFPTLAQ